ncbi:molybdenum cofactor biosynthesis protein MoaE [Methylococcus sp. EFPC2]|uniref:molybdenum cofactor biosynthesis protein MoaE n=1 Tax=Methylococcus sp. EFPC2 TaxID=2812648 RepID=UPI001968149A|nr:molybdenum cofactor biosynthesis protein MoaE [Methylococcus sp. EFPC2]QSA96255.1 molybdenum cofactor biosynthesis protein MoaE [Methylococcus sp. EFPC2]
MASIELRDAPFLPYRELEAFQAALPELAGRYGATASFVGSLRDFNEGEAVSGMFLEHYPGMTERRLADIVDQAREHWPFLEALVIHRIGQIRPHEAIVLVAIWSAHRGAAFDACRWIMEELKNSAPFWKKETLPEGEQRWVQHNTDGY